jgi:CubicO group peptidase (beta-lactamase class C family)
MMSNHLPDGRDLRSMSLPGTTLRLPGTRFGLGFALLLDPATAGVVGTLAEVYWWGAHSTYFWVTPAEDLAVLFLAQLIVRYPFNQQLRATVYPAIID